MRGRLQTEIIERLSISLAGRRTHCTLAFLPAKKLLAVDICYNIIDLSKLYKMTFIISDECVVMRNVM